MARVLSGWIPVAALAAACVACGRDGAPAGPAGDPATPQAHSEDTPPNVILVVLDTARADHMSYNGYGQLTTPYVDALARDAVVYRQAHSVAPWTLPAHASMFTGLLPGQHGATWRAFATPEEMDLGEILDRRLELPAPLLLPERLRRLGYTCVGFSSNAWVARRTSFDRGFDAFYEMWQERRAYQGRFHRPTPAQRLAPELSSGDAGYVLLKLDEHLAAHGELREPFFLFFNFIDPHFPYSPPTLWRYGFTRNRLLGEKLARFELSEIALVAGARPVEIQQLIPFYDAEMSYVDFAVGRLLSWLKAEGYYDESMIVVTSDHGEHLGEGGRFAHQFSVEEELLHVPLVIKYPHGVQAGRVVDDPRVSNLDVYATILRAAGGDGGSEGLGAPSLDLGDMESFARPFLLAESYYSLPFLRLHHDRFSGFSIAEHRVVRRVVFDGEGRYVFVAGDEAEPAPEVPGDDPGRVRAAAWLRRYLESLDGGALEAADAPLDEETRRRLRALGYAD